jgi:hypothetical protein
LDVREKLAGAAAIVTVALTDGDVPLLWEPVSSCWRVSSMSRAQAGSGLPSRRSERVGAGIELTWGEKAAPLAALADWAAGRDGYAAMPAQLYMLRNLLIEELVSVGDLSRSAAEIRNGRVRECLRKAYECSRCSAYC